MTASGGSVTESPEWLYFVTITSSVPRYSRGPNPGIHVHDRVPEIARANASTLRTLALASDAGDNRATGQFGVLARPHGQSPSTRTNPDNPWNRKALLKLIDRGTLSVGARSGTSRAGCSMPSSNLRRCRSQVGQRRMSNSGDIDAAHRSLLVPQMPFVPPSDEGSLKVRGQRCWSSLAQPWHLGSSGQERSSTRTAWSTARRARCGK